VVAMVCVLGFVQTGNFAWIIAFVVAALALGGFVVFQVMRHSGEWRWMHQTKDSLANAADDARPEDEAS